MKFIGNRKTALMNAGNYSLYGYYDKAPSSGGRIRVIVAYAN